MSVRTPRTLYLHRRFLRLRQIHGVTPYFQPKFSPKSSSLTGVCMRTNFMAAYGEEIFLFLLWTLSCVLHRDPARTEREDAQRCMRGFRRRRTTSHVSSAAFCLKKQYLVYGCNDSHHAVLQYLASILQVLSPLMITVQWLLH